MNRVKFTILAIMVAVTVYLLLLPSQPDAVWLKWLSIALWIVLIIIIARNSDLFDRVKLDEVDEPKGVEVEDNLKKFLIRKGAYEKFLANANPARSYFNQINGSFVWSITPEGYDYWRGLHYEYYEERENKLGVKNKLHSLFGAIRGIFHLSKIVKFWNFNT